jgi:hypothetical protein
MAGQKRGTLRSVEETAGSLADYTFGAAYIGNQVI